MRIMCCDLVNWIMDLNYVINVILTSYKQSMPPDEGAAIGKSLHGQSNSEYRMDGGRLHD
jgi:hypothetical protein